MKKPDIFLIPLGVLLGVLISGLVFLITIPPRGEPILLAPAATASPITVQISGAVSQPGVYQLPKDSRVVELVETAGGFSEEANKESINLAAKLRDGENIHISTILEKNTAINTGLDSSEKPTPNIQFPININIATQDELEQLPGIGPAKASDIISYREINGDFQLIDDIQNVSGIGPATFENLKEYITTEFTP